MEEYPGRRVSERINISRRVPTIPFSNRNRETSSKTNELSDHPSSSSRISRISSIKSRPISIPDKSAPKSAPGSSSNPSKSILRRPYNLKQKQTLLHGESSNSNSSSMSELGPTKQRNKQITLGRPGVGPASQRRGIKSLGCTSVSDILPPRSECGSRLVERETRNNVLPSSSRVNSNSNNNTLLQRRARNVTVTRAPHPETRISSSSSRLFLGRETDDRAPQSDDLSGSSRGGSSSSRVRVSPHLELSEEGATSEIMNRGHQRLNLDGIAEVLLALERIEQDEELSYEQLLILETNLLLGRLTFHDQHRDMRMDIDNMSYEELLALEEKMGTVSTALTEEQMESCLERLIFLSENTPQFSDDTKCSICQEEYEEREELGKMKCEHMYHMSCIKHWLSHKNWCPVCKSPALESD